MSDGFIIRRCNSGGSKDYSAFKALVDKSITEVTSDMLYGLTSISNFAFYECSSLASVTIPNIVTSIGNSAFRYCSSLASVTIPNSVTFIGNNAFRYCSSLASVTLEATTPPTLSSNYGYYPFDDCSALVAFYVPSESVDVYKTAINWSNYADKIQAIPSD